MHFSKKILTTIVLIASLTQALIQPFIYLEYQIRKDYIVKELCEQRYTKINLCDGRCFFVKKLNKQQQKESEEKERNIRPVDIKLFLVSRMITQFELDKVEIAESTESINHYAFLFSTSILHPPQG